MDADWKSLLALIGNELDSGLYPTVYNGGIVRPSNPSVSNNPQGEEKRNEQPTRQRRPSAGSWQGAAGRQGSTDRHRPPDRAASLIDPSVRRAFDAEVDAIHAAYPGTEVWLREDGVWLRTQSQVLDGLARRATFLVSIPFDRGDRARSWAYWNTVVSLLWIGPRHTNFPDGSICAFEPRDRTWRIGDSIVKLFDLYTLWTLRHLYLEVFGRWPGYQSVHIPYERLQELHDNEFCGCDHSHRRYSECCKPADLALDRQQALLDFLERTGGAKNGGRRKPPDWVPSVVSGAKAPPLGPIRVSR